MSRINKRSYTANRPKYSYETNLKFANDSMSEAKKFIADIIMSSDHEVLKRFWLPFAYTKIHVNIPYFHTMMNIIDTDSENRLDDDDYEELQHLLCRHWIQIYLYHGVEGFFEFLDIIDNESMIFINEGENMTEVLV